MPSLIHVYAAKGEYEKVETELNKGIDVNAKMGHIENTALNAAAEEGQVAIVKLLLKKGADIYIKNNVNNNPLDSALLTLLLAVTNKKYENCIPSIPNYKLTCKLLMAYGEKNPPERSEDGFNESMRHFKERFMNSNDDALQGHISEIIDPKNWPSLSDITPHKENIDPNVDNNRGAPQLNQYGLRHRKHKAPSMLSAFNSFVGDVFVRFNKGSDVGSGPSTITTIHEKEPLIRRSDRKEQ